MTSTTPAITTVNEFTATGTLLSGGTYYLGQYEIDGRTRYAVADIQRNYCDVWSVFHTPNVATVQEPLALVPTAVLTTMLRQERVATERYLELSAAQEIVRTQSNALTQAVRERDEALTSAANAAQEMFDKFQSIGREVAEESNFCSEYERVGQEIADKFGFTFIGRTRDYLVRGHVQGLRVDLTVNCGSDDWDELKEEISESELCEAIREALDHDSELPELARDAIRSYVNREHMKHWFAINYVELA